MKTKALIVTAIISLLSYNGFAQTTTQKASKTVASSNTNKNSKSAKESLKAALKKKTPKELDSKPVEELPKFVEVNPVNTYERIIDKGYESPDMLKKAADKRFFEGDLKLAARWYACLFDITSDVEPVYYYRYSASLKSIGQEEKATKMMELYKGKSTKE